MPDELASPSDPHGGGTSGSARECVLTVICDDRPGIVHEVSGFLVRHSANIVESQHFDDLQTRRFFMRVRFEATSGLLDPVALRQDFVAVAEKFGMEWELWDTGVPYRTLLMVSQHLHCLNDLLFRWSTGSLNIEIPAIVSNHQDAKRLADIYELPFHHIPVTASTKASAERQLSELADEHAVHLIVLARYMQILSDDLCTRWSGRIINIHHSFLPSFKGAKPYHQAFERGVKLIGATAHYVTADLDEGPIIEQDVLRVDHRLQQDQLVAAGRDVEAQVLSRALRWHAESRVLMNGHRTVVFT
ncbi:formyltetrahydrofolate deformylase [Nocardioides bigeumensis]|uniref:Formyltetrahydrofolate deformylase n=1 Tax=Nocardioides bigeumensis TaxID=433657 RepID=A0ABN2YVS7_9ACTN